MKKPQVWDVIIWWTVWKVFEHEKHYDLVVHKYDWDQLIKRNLRVIKNS